MSDGTIVSQPVMCRCVDFIEKSPGVYVSSDTRFTCEYTYDELYALAAKHQIEIRVTHLQCYI